MKLMKRTNIYKASNLTFNPVTLDAFSYGWWQFVGVVDGKVIFNTYRYSNSTSKHQSKVRRLINQLGIKVDIFMPIPKGLPKSNARGCYGVLDMKRGEMTLADLIIEAEEYLCDQFLKEKSRNIKAYERKKASQASLLERTIENAYNKITNEVDHVQL